MKKKIVKIGTASLVAAGAAGVGAAVLSKNKKSQEKTAAKEKRAKELREYRNTERGKQEKNSKGIYYTNGNYEAFARPQKPEGVDDKSAYIVGSGLGALAAACFLVRDGQMQGKNIHILEAMDIAGGACDGINDPTRGFVMRGGREMENHFECLWDLFHSIPSLEVPGASVLDEFYWLNKKDPNYSLCRATKNRGEDAHTDGKFNLSQKGSMEIMKLFFTPNEDLYDKTIEDVFDEEVFNSTFWLYWRTMFAFENWHSALEMKLYFQRFIHHIGGLPDFSALKFTKYNQYESLILPMKKYLEAAGVKFQFNTEVTNVIFDFVGDKKIAKTIVCKVKGEEQEISLTENALVFVTNGSCTEGTIYGDHDHAPVGDAEVRTSGCWNLWKNIAAQDEAFGRPEKFCSDIEKTNWESATATTSNDTIISYIEKICKRDPRSGQVVTGGIVSCQDSSWLLSWTINRQGQFKEQKKEDVCVWIYSLFTDVPGDYIKKPMKECSGKEITAEWLYHLGVPVEEIDALAENEVVCVPTMMPYITAFFMPRTKGDRPDVIPDGCVNFAFLGQFAETPRDTIFTTEYSVRTAMEAVYGLLGVDRGVPEVWGSVYDIRELLDSSVKLMDGKSPLEIELPGPLNALKKPLLKKLKGTVIEKVLRDHDIIRDEML
ncbi:MAG: oleate hydratase [bacterium]|nr:oleate hydratase [bacterium]